MSTVASLSRPAYLLAAETEGLTHSARRLLVELDRRAKGHPECWTSTAKLAKALKCCERTIRNGIKALKRLGLVRVVIDHTLNSYRRIKLLWRGQWTPEPAPSKELDSTVEHPANSYHGMRQILTPPPSPPLEPPYKEPDGRELKEIDGGSPEATTPPPRSDVSQPQQEKAVEPIAPAVARAEQVFGADPSTPGRIGWFVKRFGIGWVLRGLDQCQAKAQRGYTVGYGYLRRTLEGYRADGGPPPPVVSQSQQFADALEVAFAELVAEGLV